MEHGEIVGVTGPQVDTDEEGNVRIAHIEGLRQGRDRSLLVEVKLRTAEGNPPNKLKLTLRSPGAEPDEKDGAAVELAAFSESTDTALLAWPVTDCAGGYLAALRQIGEEKGNRLREIWREASRPEKSMPREWLFRPALPKSSSRRRKVAPADVTASLAAQDAREIFLEAGRLLRAGYDPDLGLKGRHSFTLSKTSNDLRKYFSQDENAAICTGAIAFTNYYEGKLSPLRKRGEQADDPQCRGQAACPRTRGRDLRGGAWLSDGASRLGRRDACLPAAGRGPLKRPEADGRGPRRGGRASR